MVSILTENVTTSVNLTTSLNIIGAASAPGLNVLEEYTNSIILRRGDADKNGAISVVDSLVVK